MAPTTERPWSDEAKTLLDFLYRFWAEQRRPPGIEDIFRGTGFEFRDIRRLFRELQEGFALVFTDGSLNLNLQKVTPFSATPTPVYIEHNGSFHSYVGCPAEALTVSAMPMFVDSVLTVRSSCACCFAPIAFDLRNLDVRLDDAAEPVVSIVGSPYEWENGVAADRVCDAIHFVLDAEHAQRYEQQVSRRGVVVTLPQMLVIATPVAKARMWDPDWLPMRVTGRSMVGAFESTGVDVAAWR